MFYFTNLETNTESSKATEMLKESIERLNINVPNSDFRKNASNVIAAMLEARLGKQQSTQSPKASPPRPLKKSQQLTQKQPIPPPPPPSILKKSSRVDPEFLPPPPPICEELSYNNHTKKLNGNRIFDQTSFKDDLPLPPPPSILTPPLSSDENDVPQTISDKSNGVEKVNLRNKKYHHNGHNNQSSVGFNDTNGGNKFELSSHARDRRSYIEKLDNQLSNVEGDELDVTKIANGLANGKHPVCDKCKCKITR